MDWQENTSPGGKWDFSFIPDPITPYPVEAVQSNVHTYCETFSPVGQPMNDSSVGDWMDGDKASAGHGERSAMDVDMANILGIRDEAECAV